MIASIHANLKRLNPSHTPIACHILIMQPSFACKNAFFFIYWHTLFSFILLHINRMSGSYPESSRRVAPVVVVVELPRAVAEEEVAQRKQGSVPTLVFITKNQAHLPQSQSHSHRSSTHRLTPLPHSPTVTDARTTAQLPRSTCPVSPPLQPQQLPTTTTTSTPASTYLLSFPAWTHLHASQEASESRLSRASGHCRRISSFHSFSLSQWHRRHHCHLSFMAARLTWAYLVGHGPCKRTPQRLNPVVVVVVVLGWAWVPLSSTACGPTKTLYIVISVFPFVGFYVMLMMVMY